jgi:GNAT superfamily N-acetyltransferase
MIAELSGLEVRPAMAEDEPDILALLRRTMGWSADGRDEPLFTWKHRQNPFGASPAWVARHGGALVGYRTFMRWQFLDNEDRVVTAVRAVDTVTAPEYRGRGVFRLLTLQAIDELRAAGVDLVFNTPNEQSRPGYLRMGWRQAGRLPVGVLPRGVAAAGRMLRARVPADLWSQPTAAGQDAITALADDATVEGLLGHAPHDGVRTKRTAEYLRWRVSLPALHYRVLMASPRDPGHGGLLIRVRNRGESRELVVAESFVDEARTEWKLLRRAITDTGADYAIGLRTRPLTTLAPLPRQGPVLTTLALSQAAPPAPGWRLSLGDIELF